MDILLNGSDIEKNQFSFALMDIQETGYISFAEFKKHIAKVISHWSSLINTHVKIDKKRLRAIFSEIDSSGDGIIDFNEYSSALERNPNLIDWF